jgi:uncharacterized protein
MAKNDGSFWKRGPVVALLVLLACTGVVAGGAFAFLHLLTHPPRDRAVLDPADLLLHAEDVEMQAADGVPLSGWLVQGAPGRPAIILCHDLGQSRSSLLNTAAALSRKGYPLLLLDFRGHGQSGGTGSTLGIDERLDVLAAVALLQDHKEIDGTRIGLWGVGMGAYAGALAAREEPTLRALALDALHPDVPAELDRLARQRIPPAADAVIGLLRPFYNAYFGFRLPRFSIARAAGELSGRDLLLIAGSDDPALFQQEKALYASLPENPEGDKNFLELRASVRSGLYAEDKRRYDEAIVGFFSTYLGAKPHRAAPAGKIEVLER